MKTIIIAIFLLLGSSILFAQDASALIQDQATTEDTDSVSADSPDLPEGDLPEGDSPPTDETPPPEAEQDTIASREQNPGTRERPVRESRYDQNIYMRGDLSAQVKLGVSIPAYIHSFGFASVGKFQLSPGLLLGVGIDAYLSNNFKMGGELSFSTSTGINGGRAFFVPIVFRAFYEFHLYSWSFPLGGSVGLNIASYNSDMTAFSFIFRPEVGAIYQITQNWGIGVVATWAIAPQVVWKDLPKSRVGNSFEVALLGQYHF